MNYFTIKEIYEHEIINKKSRFICKLIPVSNKEMVDSYLKSFKKNMLMHDIFVMDIL